MWPTNSYCASAVRMRPLPSQFFIWSLKTELAQCDGCNPGWLLEQLDDTYTLAFPAMRPVSLGLEIGSPQ